MDPFARPQLCHPALNKEPALIKGPAPEQELEKSSGSKQDQARTGRPSKACTHLPQPSPSHPHDTDTPQTTSHKPKRARNLCQFPHHPQHTSHPTSNTHTCSSGKFRSAEGAAENSLAVMLRAPKQIRPTICLLISPALACSRPLELTTH